MTGASGAAQTAEAFSYDTNGNRTNGSVVTGQYNRITSDGTFSYQYDKEGNRTRRTTISTGEYEAYAWDYRQRLVSITRYSSTNAVQWTLTYEYDGLDRRTRRTVRNAAGTVTSQQRFLYDSNVLSSAHPLGGDGALRADEAANWEPVILLDERLAGEPYQEVDHRYLNGPLIDQVFADETGGNGVLWYLSDTQNTVRDVAKYESTTAGTQATVRNHLEYNTFGIVTTADDPTTVTVNDGDRPGLEGAGNEFSPQRSYTGREPDTATGLIYYRARWFDPRLGRFISEDPIGFAAGDANLSRYVGNSTPNAVDPSGLFGIPASYADLSPEAAASLPAHIQDPFGAAEESSLADPYPEVYPPPAFSAHDAKEAAYFDRRAAIRKQIAQLRANNHPDADMIANHLERQLAGESGFGLWFSYNGIGTQIAMNLAEAYAAGGGRGSIPARRSICAVPTQPLIPPVRQTPVKPLRGGLPRPPVVPPTTPRLVAPRAFPANSITASEAAEIQAIAKKYNTTIDVVGSRAAGEGRNIGTNLPVGKQIKGGPPTRSDIDFRIDAAHPQAEALIKELQGVGNGAGTAGPKWSTSPLTPGGRPTVPPFIRFNGNE